MNYNNINYVFTGFAVIMCLVMAYFALFTDLFGGMKNSNRQILAIVMLSYAAFRVYRMVKSIKKSNSNNEEL